MRKRSTTLLISTLVISLLALAPVGAHERSGERTQVDWAEVVQEQSHADAPDANADPVGWSRLVRSEDGLRATLIVRGLNPGGVYTFWWVVPQEFAGGEPVIPGGVFVARGAARVIGRSGMAVVHMRAREGQEGIEGFPPLGGAEWKTLDDPLNSIVRVEIAYHGQREDAGSDLRTWMSDFWTGAACPAAGETNDGGQPHCPVYLAATHTP